MKTLFFFSDKKYCLVSYIEDSILNVVLVKSLKYINEDKVSAPYKNMGRYEAVPVEFSNDRKLLVQKMKEMKMDTKMKQGN